MHRSGTGPAQVRRKSCGAHHKAYAALALAHAGDSARAETLINDAIKDSSLDDDDQQHSLLRSSDYRVEPCNPSGAIEELHRAIPYDLASDSNALTLYLRGSAYLGLKLGREPAAQFQKILDNHGLVTTHVNWPLAHLARAYALQDDPAKARAALSGFPRVLERRRH